MIDLQAYAPSGWNLLLIPKSKKKRIPLPNSEKKISFLYPKYPLSIGKQA